MSNSNVSTLTIVGLTADPEIYRELEKTVGVEQQLADQAAAQGRIVAAFFTALKDNGVPMDLAASLTTTWHNWHTPIRFWLQEAAAVADGRVVDLKKYG